MDCYNAISQTSGHITVLQVMTYAQLHLLYTLAFYIVAYLHCHVVRRFFTGLNKHDRVDGAILCPGALIMG